MSLPKDDDATLSARWSQGVLLKRDVFSTVERGRFRGDDGEVDGVLRRLDQVPFWSFAVALHLFSRERRALTLARDLNVGPKLLWAGRRALVRGFIDGAALHLAKPHGDVAYFRSAKQALRKLHRAGICHNDLAKEQNWLVGRDGRAYLTDFQLAACFKSRSRLFRLAAYEDLRHLLKHKRSYAPEALTPKERKVLAKKSAVASVWLKTGKKVYQAITRGMADQSRTIRLPVHLVEQVNKLSRIRREMYQSLGREPTNEELAEESGIEESKIEMLLRQSRDPVSLDMPVGADEEAPLGDFIEDAEATDAEDAVVTTLRHDDIEDIINGLEQREQDVIRMRYGLTDGVPRTLDQIGRQFGLSRERVRQIEREVMAKLRAGERADRLRDYAL